MKHFEAGKIAKHSKLCSLDQYVGNIVGAFALAVSDKISRAVCEATGLSSSACSAIITVGTEPDSSIETLRHMLSLEHSSLVRLLNRLEQLGLLQRNRGTREDQRIVTISLTRKGETHFDAIVEARRNVLEGLVSSMEEAELKAVGTMINRMMPNVVERGDDQHYVCRLCNMEVCPQEVCPVNLAFPEFYEHPDQPFRRKWCEQGADTGVAASG